jgi:hypothetical protein
MSRTSLPVVLSDAEVLRLEQWLRAGSTPQQVVLRAQIIRRAAQGQSDRATASALGIRREGAPSRAIILGNTYTRLNGLPLKQDDLFRQSLRCLEEQLFRAAHVMAWAAFMDFFEHKVTEDGFVKLHAAYPAWSSHKTLDELRENVVEFQLIEAAHKKLSLCTKAEMKALHGMLSKRNECAHPSNYYPGLNESLGYISELLNRLELIQKRPL